MPSLPPRQINDASSENYHRLQAIFYEPSLSRSERLAVWHQMGALLLGAVHAARVQNIRLQSQAARESHALAPADTPSQRANGDAVSRQTEAQGQVQEGPTIVPANISDAPLTRSPIPIDTQGRPTYYWVGSEVRRTRNTHSTPIHLIERDSSFQRSPQRPRASTQALQRIRVPASPVLYDFPYDKLVRDRASPNIGESLTYVYSDDQGREQPQPARFSRTHHDGLPLGRGNRYLTMANKSLVETRQARALAGLDTDDMDLAIAQRVLHYPTAWGNLGYIMVEATADLCRSWINMFLDL